MALQSRNTAHSFENALALAQASALAYCDEAEFKAAIGAIVGIEPVEVRQLFNTRYQTRVYLAKFDDAILISFEGTRVAANWLTNFEIHLVPFRKAGMVHLGFQKALESVLPQILEIPEEWSGGGRTLWLTGHSLGGALAMLLAAYLRLPADSTSRLPVPVSGIYTFGQPRVGTHEFCDAAAASFGKFYFRYVNKEDIVTRVPPRLLAYWHVDNVEFITFTGSIEADPAWWYVFLDQVKAGTAALQKLELAQPLIQLVGDHSIVKYVSAIAAQIGGTVSTALPAGV